VLPGAGSGAAAFRHRRQQPHRCHRILAIVRPPGSFRCRGSPSRNYDLDYGEEVQPARIIVRSADGGTEGLFLVDQEGACEPAEDLDGFGINPARDDGIWSDPPAQMIEEAAGIARVKAAMSQAGDEGDGDWPARHTRQ